MFNPELLLIGVDSVGHGVLVFVVSLIAILAFSSLTQGWLMVRLRVWEGVLLALVMVSLFRPDFVLNQVRPEFSSVGIAEVEAAASEVPADRKVRLHVVRPTDYGDRYKLFTISPPPPQAASRSPSGSGSSSPRPRAAGSRSPTPPSTARPRRPGVTFGDRITDIDVEQVDRPPKEIVYPLGLAVLALVLLSQWRRRRAA